MFVSNLIFLTIAYRIDFTLGTFIAEDLGKVSVEYKVVWISGS